MYTKKERQQYKGSEQMSQTYLFCRLSYDYDKQAWIKDGVYQNCGHPKDVACNCYGRRHAGEEAVVTEQCK